MIAERAARELQHCSPGLVYLRVRYLPHIMVFSVIALPKKLATNKHPLSDLLPHRGSTLLGL